MHFFLRKKKREKREKRREGKKMIKKPIVFIFATGPNGEFSNQGRLPWPKNHTDLKLFKKTTSVVDYSSDDGVPTPLYVTNAVIMGRKTWDSLPDASRPLPDRYNIVVSSSDKIKSGKRNEIFCIAKNVASAIDAANANSQVQTIFIIGGVSIFEDCLSHLPFFCKEMIHTTIQGDFEADVHLYYEKMIGIFSKIDTVSHYTDDISGLKCCVRKWTNPDYGKIPYSLSLFGTTLNALEHCHSEDDVEDCLERTTSFMHGDAPSSSSSQYEQPVFPICGEDFKKVYYSDSGPLTLFPLGNVEEFQYLKLVEEIINGGDEREDRTKVGTRAVFGKKMTFSLRGGVIPLLTTKRIPFGCVAKELLWFISGCTDSKKLSEVGVKIWNANGSRAFLDNLGFLDRETGDLGPVYGFQWRHFGAKYVNCHTDYTGQGVDQLAECIRKIRENPTDRRIIMSAWNPADLSLMALPPCHMFCQFFVSNGELSCMMYQRSADMGLGVPFNIASYALLTHMVAHVCNLKPGEFHHVIGDCHVYLNHILALKEQSSRVPRPFPTLEFNQQVTSIDNFKFEDFKVIDYNPYPNIPMEMAL